MATVFTRLEAYGYRCFPAFSVDLGPYHVLTGANGAGKTTLLDIPTLLGELLGAARPSDVFLRTQGSHPVPRARTVGELLHNGRGNAITFSVEARLPADVENALATTSTGRLRTKPLTHLRYELSLEVFNYDLQVAEEYLFLFSERGDRPQAGVRLQGSPSGGRLRREWRSVISRGPGSDARFTAEPTTRTPRLPQFQIPDDKLALAALPADPTLFPAALWFIELLREGVVFFSPDCATLQHGSAPNDPSTLLPSGRNLTWLALELQRANENTRDDGFASWVDHVRTALPQIEGISVRERESDRYAYFVVDYAGGYQVTSSGLSEGTLRILALTLLPYLTPTMGSPAAGDRGAGERHSPSRDRNCDAVAALSLRHAGVGVDALAARDRADQVGRRARRTIGQRGRRNRGGGQSAPEVARLDRLAGHRHPVRRGGAVVTERDIVFLVADSAMEQLLRGFFGRDQCHHALGCRPIDFDPNQDLFVAPTKDPGVYSTARELLRPVEKLYRRAVVMLDAEWDGSPGAYRIRAHITQSLQDAWAQFEVIVIEPELEAWIWQDNPHVAKALKCRADFRKVLHYSEHWPEGQAKPKDPKAALEYLRREQRADRSNALFRRLAGTVSVRGCQDEAHQLLRNTLCTWFPEAP